MQRLWCKKAITWKQHADCTPWWDIWEGYQISAINRASLTNIEVLTKPAMMSQREVNERLILMKQDWILVQIKKAALQKHCLVSVHGLVNLYNPSKGSHAKSDEQLHPHLNQSSQFIAKSKFIDLVDIVMNKVEITMNNGQVIFTKQKGRKSITKGRYFAWWSTQPGAKSSLDNSRKHLAAQVFYYLPKI